MVDDSHIARVLLTQTLGSRGFDVRAVGSGVAALAELARAYDTGSRIDLVLMDKEMPGMDGLTTARQIRADVRFRDLPMVAMTADSSAGDRALSLDAGLNDHVAKSIEPEKLMEILGRWLPVVPPSDSPTVSVVAANGARMPVLPAQLAAFDLPAALRRANSNPMLLRKLIGMFVETYAGAIPALQRYIAEANYRQAQILVHSLRGTAATLEILGVQEAAGAVEHALREGRIESVPALVDTLGAVLAPALASAATLRHTGPTVLPTVQDAPVVRDPMQGRVLVVDDELTNGELMADIFGADYEVLRATTGENALALAIAAQPDVILLDVMMPGMDGYELCKRLKAESVTSGIPIIFITSLGDVDAETRGLELGAIDYVTKPFSPPVVKMRVRNHIELKRAREKLTQLATTDGLTGLANRRHFDEALAREISRHSRSGGTLSLILLDIDHFKAFNDIYGHVNGDDCLRRVAQVVGSSLGRAVDLAARYGGEEFACILPETSLEGARAVAEKIRQGIVALNIPHAGSRTAACVSASLGVVSERCVVGSSMLDIVAHADTQLYAAKSSGRNRVRF